MALWNVEIMGPTTNWRELTPYDYKNVVGLACGGARRDAETLESIGPIPGTFRYTVKPGSIVRNVSAVLLCDVILVGDLHHPYINKTTGYTVNLDTWSPIYAGDTGVEIFVNKSITESCVFEIGSGYELSSTGTWTPITSFGVNFPSNFGRSAYLRLTNTSNYDQCDCRITWTNSGGTPSLWRVRMQSGDWSTSGSNELLFNADGALDGLVPQGESVILEVQPFVPDGTTATDNPIIGEIQIFSVSI